MCYVHVPGSFPQVGLQRNAVGRFLRTATGIAKALGKFHQRGLVHKDIKPANNRRRDRRGAAHRLWHRLASATRAPGPRAAGGDRRDTRLHGPRTDGPDEPVDRSDLYALGVTLYEMLRGELPFTASDPMEWVHCHIARQPPPPDERVSGIPRPVSAMVMKLLAKTAEDRYQTAAGLSVDLRKCDDATAIPPQEPVISDDASREKPFSADEYVASRHVRSVLFLPLIKQAKLVGVLYIENNVAASVFTPARIAVLQLLASQAAISLDNARLYGELTMSEERWRQLFESVPVGVTLLGSDRRYVAVNPAFQKMTGYSEAELRLLSPTDITHEDDQAATEAIIAIGAAAQSYATRIEKRYRRKDGGVIWAEVDSFLAPGAGSAPLRAAVAVDITERKLAEEALRDARADLERMARLTTMGELTASIAHEINQPVCAIVTQSESALRFLNRDEPDLDEVRDALSCITRDGVRAAEVIRGLRALARKFGPQLARLDIDDVVREVLALAGGELRRHDVVLHAELAADEQPVMGDRVQLQQVLLNLIMNGVEAMRGVTERTRELTVSSTLAEPGSLLVAVKDTGTGLDPAVAERMFQPLFTTKPDGLGMGLAICRSILEAHGGRLWVLPRTPHGTDVRFTVPLWAEQ